MNVFPGLSVLLFFVAVVMLGASVVVRHPLPAEYGVQRGDAGFLAAGGSLAAVIAGLFVLLGALPIPAS